MLTNSSKGADDLGDHLPHHHIDLFCSFGVFHMFLNQTGHILRRLAPIIVPLPMPITSVVMGRTTGQSGREYSEKHNQGSITHDSLHEIRKMNGSHENALRRVSFLP